MSNDNTGKKATKLDPQDLLQLKGLGPAIKEKLTRLKVFCLRDLLLHLPFRYQDRTKSVSFRDALPNQEVLITGEILSSTQNFGRRRSLLITLTDHTGFINVRLYHFSRFQKQNLRVGMFMRCFGSMRYSHSGLEMVHPEYSTFEDQPEDPDPELTPVYHTTEGLSQNKIRALCRQVLELDLQIPSVFSQPSAGTVSGPESYSSEITGIELKQAIYQLHRPLPDCSADSMLKAQERVAMEELIAHFINSKRHKELSQLRTARKLPRSTHLGRQLLPRLGFSLTEAQKRVTTDVLNDLEKDVPMLRLLQGDVGSGKTVIAAFAAIRAAENGYQTAILVPTEILAEQHFITFSSWLKPLGIQTTLLTAKLGATQRKSALAAIKSGHAAVIVGTHALFQDSVEFNNLALTIVDEQHRFGVEQRLKLKDKSGHEAAPHQLVMTATPIPRTLTMTLYAGMDVSIIDELPKNRLPIQTRVLSIERKPEVIQSLAGKDKKQVYWVCTLIEESEQLDSTAAETAATELTEQLPERRVELVHGRMSAQDKNAIMNRFKNAEVDILVATTVVEVGVDVPNASLIVIENAERLGLSQLHQLRGRVGRGSQQSHCILLYGTPLGASGKQRLEVMRASTDGFYIAEQDLKLRGPGELLGTRQTGEQLFRIADIFEHAHLLAKSRELAEGLAEDEPELCNQIMGFWSHSRGEFTTV